MDIEAYEKVKRDAAVQVDLWFTKNPDHWRDKARQVLALCETWEQEELAWREQINKWERKGSKPPKPVRDSPSGFHPILHWTLGWTGSKTIIPEFTEQEANKALLCYYAAMIVLHDTAGQGYISIAGDIWPGYESPKALPTGKDQKDTWPVYGRAGGLWNLVSYAFHPVYGDKSRFIYGALRAVGEDLRLRPVTKKAYVVYELLKALPDGKGLTAPEIMKTLDQYEGEDFLDGIILDTGTLKEIFEELKPYGLRNRPRVGYYIQK